jgi:choline dehydrogenase-like flavoprotein
MAATPPLPDPVVVVGSGASGVHFAETALALGRRVVMLDVGHPAPPPVRPEASLNALKAGLDDPAKYFLGEDFGSLILPEDGSEYYGFPPAKSYVFRPVEGRRVDAHGFAPLASFAAGGLAQAWTGGCYPFSDGELAAYPVGWADMEPAYAEVARRIGISGTDDDDLAPYYPTHDGLMPPIDLDAHSSQLLGVYERKRGRRGSGRTLALGRARLASLSRDHDGRRGCSKSGRCIWGCPSQSLYTPSVTLERLKRHERFAYVPGVRIDRFGFDDASRVDRVHGEVAATGETFEREVGTLALAAGTLGTARIVLESLNRAGQAAELTGLMDNRQVLMPFVNLARIGAAFDAESYQYHQLAIGAPGPTPFDYVHGLVTTLTTALIHPVAQTLPVSARAAVALFRNLHGALGLVNINFADTRRETNRVGLDVGPDGRTRALLVHYEPDAKEPERVKPAIATFRNFMLSLGCVAPPSMTRLRPMGASVHYAGTLPMTADGGELTTDRAGRCRPFTNLVVADGSVLPALPAKNLTFTLMANATRMAREALAS